MDTKRKFLRMLDEIRPGLAKAFFEAMSQVRSQIAFQELERAIANADVQAAFNALRLDADRLYLLDGAIAGAFVAGGRYQVDSVVAATKRFREGRKIVASFGGRNERAERIARELGSKLIVEIVDDTRQLVAEAIRSGLAEGLNPRKMALQIAGRMQGKRRVGGLVGLHGTHAGYVRNMRAELGDPDQMARYFSRKKRDKRFDSIVRQALNDGKPLHQADIDRITGRYADRLLNLRGEMIGRTETLTALNAGRQEGLQQLVDKGHLVEQQIKRRWDDTGDGRTRDTHRHADGQIVGMNEPFEVGGYKLMYPGDTSLGAPASETVACRCYWAPVIDYFHGVS